LTIRLYLTLCDICKDDCPYKVIIFPINTNHILFNGSGMLRTKSGEPQ
jgi:hypothetical protein